MKKSILLTIICFLFSSYIWSQKSAHPYNVTDSTKYRGFGVGLEFYSGHEKFSELFKLIRREIASIKTIIHNKLMKVK